MDIDILKLRHESDDLHEKEKQLISVFIKDLKNVDDEDDDDTINIAVDDNTDGGVVDDHPNHGQIIDKNDGGNGIVSSRSIVTGGDDAGGEKPSTT